MRTRLSIVALVLFSLNISAQIKIKPSGRVIVGKEIPTDDANNILQAIIYGPNGDARAGSKLAFGDFGLYERYGWNVFVGEYGASDSDQLWLHGKNGIYLTYDRDNVVGYYDIAKGNRFNFNCDVYTTGIKLSSDARFKRNVSKISNPLSMLKKLEGVSYNLSKKSVLNTNSLDDRQNISFDTQNMSVKEARDKGVFDALEKQIELDSPKRIGFIAQDLQRVFPELVESDKSGYLSVDYIGLIPVIVEALKEQSAIIDAQSLKIKELERKLVESGSRSIPSNADGVNSSTNTFLYQNTPNPFTTTTEIRYFIPEISKTASLYIFDMQGILIKSFALSSHGQGVVSIDGSELNAGMYIYSLIIDGKEIDTKRMILTQ